jgi:peptide/nickel transport system ATP-binding protein
MKPEQPQPGRGAAEHLVASSLRHSEREALLDVRELSVTFAMREGSLRAVDGVSFQLHPSEVLAIVGESGSGKSVCASTLMGLTRGPNTTIAGSARLEGEELIGASESRLRSIRGARLAMVFQDPQSSLNPVHRVGDQIAEQIRAHKPLVSKAQALDRAGELMERVGIPRARQRVRAYPHELSGGQRQRVMIAMALSLGAKVLLADEPTTALDVTVQAQILAQLKELRERDRLSIVLITHDFAVVADIADRIAVMQAGKIVEQGSAEQVLYEPQHPYTRELLRALVPPVRRRSRRAVGEVTSSMADEVDRRSVACPPAIGHDRRPASSPVASPPQARALLEIEDLRVIYPGRGRRSGGVQAVAGVSLSVSAGETLAIVGESGCGKTTTLRCIARLVEPTSGAIRLRGHDLAGARRGELAELRRDLGIVFQDPQASLNPRRRVGATLEKALHVHGLAGERARTSAGELLERVGLSAAHGARYPHELSGGQRQRVGIARALAGTMAGESASGAFPLARGEQRGAGQAGGGQRGAGQAGGEQRGAGQAGGGQRGAGQAGAGQLLLLDEPVSSLDASIRRGVIELLADLQARLGCAYVLVSHDLTTVEAVADRIAVMYAGKIVELGAAREVLEHPTHPYTQTLLASCPRLPGGVRSAGWMDREMSLQRDSSSPVETSQATRRQSFGA